MELWRPLHMYICHNVSCIHSYIICMDIYIYIYIGMFTGDTLWQRTSATRVFPKEVLSLIRGSYICMEGKRKGFRKHDLKELAGWSVISGSTVLCIVNLYRDTWTSADPSPPPLHPSHHHSLKPSPPPPPSIPQRWRIINRLQDCKIFCL